MKRLRSKSWTFTDFKLADWDWYTQNVPDVQYIIAGFEMCPSTKRFHIQGYIQFTKRIGPRAVKKKFHGSLHIEVAKGNFKQNYNYCSKSLSFLEFGEPITQGRRTDLVELQKAVEEGLTEYNIYNELPGSLRFCRHLRTYRESFLKESTRQFRNIETYVLSGPTGCGKTRAGAEICDFKIQGSQLKWWDGYEGEKSILIDEYNNDVPITTLLGLLDGYQFRLPVKGGFTYAQWTTVVITTNLSWNEIHPFAKQAHRQALKRRITDFLDFF